MKNKILEKLLNEVANEVERYAKMMQTNLSNDCMHCYNIRILNLFNRKVQQINIKLMIKSKLKELLNESEKFKVHTTLFLEHKKRNDHKTS